MKLQYLGDSKDSFKWDFHDYLVNALGNDRLNVVPMMTPDDGSTQGSSQAQRYPARPEILDFCELIKSDRTIGNIRQLPKFTSSSYSVDIHSENYFPPPGRRNEYFSSFSSSPGEVILLDPDNGFEPEKSFSSKHLLFVELDEMLKKVDERSVISVFQHFRRKPFERDFNEICSGIRAGHATAIYWHSLMFVLITKSPELHARVTRVNTAYADRQPVRILNGSCGIVHASKNRSET